MRNVKVAYEATDDYVTSSFYLTDEECKVASAMPAPAKIPVFI